ncbi:MAG: hypothetical protein AAF351_07385 [Pseudomonadota bacterium]
MNKKFFISWIVIFIAWMGGSFLVHGTLLADAYKALEPSGLVRPSEAQEAYLAYMILAHVLMSGAFVWIYQQGRQSGDWIGQGIRFGLAVVLLAAVPTYLIYYAVQPWPADLMVKQIVGDGILVIILGMLVAFLNKTD